MQVLETKCLDCGEKAKLFAVEADGNGNVAAAFACKNDYCRASFVFKWTYGRTSRKYGLKKIECLEGIMSRVSSRGFGVNHLSCPDCGGLTIIRRKVINHREMITLYHRCKSCGLGFNSYMEYSHQISVSAFKHGEVIKHILSIIPAEQLKGLMNGAGNSAFLPKN
ncbi:TPA: hypothetical protein SLG82_002964 [Citrobacter freundii]|nr:hypothetical protein [Citrobacter freundii]HEI8801199.1 hypothetical protein [Citrobacter freundii]